MKVAKPATTGLDPNIHVSVPVILGLRPENPLVFLDPRVKHEDDENGGEDDDFWVDIFISLLLYIM